MTDEAMSPLRRRMIEDVTIRKFASETLHNSGPRARRL
jgi:integrase/recombinase XerD